MEATCFTHVTLFGLILLLFGQEYNVCSSSLWRFLQPPATIFLLLVPDFLLRALFHHPQPITFFTRNCFRHQNSQQNCSFEFIYHRTFTWEWKDNMDGSRHSPNVIIL